MASLPAFLNVNMGFYLFSVNRYQQMLHRNLVYLATIADSNQNMQSLLPAVSMGPGRRRAVMLQEGDNSLVLNWIHSDTFHQVVQTVRNTVLFLAPDSSRIVFSDFKSQTKHRAF